MSYVKRPFPAVTVKHARQYLEKAGLVWNKIGEEQKMLVLLYSFVDPNLCLVDHERHDVSRALVEAITEPGFEGWPDRRQNIGVEGIEDCGTGKLRGMKFHNGWAVLDENDKAIVDCLSENDVKHIIDSLDAERAKRETEETFERQARQIIEQAKREMRVRDLKYISLLTHALAIANLTYPDYTEDQKLEIEETITDILLESGEASNEGDDYR